MRHAVDGAPEQLVVGPVPDAQVRGPGPSSPVLGVRCRERGDGARGAVGDEGGVGGDVGDQVVEGRGAVGEDPAGG